MYRMESVTVSNHRWHWYVAPEDWEPPNKEEREGMHEESKLTTAHMTLLHPDIECSHLSTKFLDLSRVSPPCSL